MDYTKEAREYLESAEGFTGTDNEAIFVAVKHTLIGIGYAILALQEAIAKPQVKTKPYKLYLDGEEIDPKAYGTFDSPPEDREDVKE